MGGIGAAEPGYGNRGIAAHNGRMLLMADEIDQGVDEWGAVGSGVDALQAVEAVLQSQQRRVRATEDRQIAPQGFLGVAVGVHHLLARQVERCQQ